LRLIPLDSPPHADAKDKLQLATEVRDAIEIVHTSEYPKFLSAYLPVFQKAWPRSVIELKKQGGGGGGRGGGGGWGGGVGCSGGGARGDRRRVNDVTGTRPDKKCSLRHECRSTQEKRFKMRWVTWRAISARP